MSLLSARQVIVLAHPSSSLVLAKHHGQRADIEARQLFSKALQPYRLESLRAEKFLDHIRIDCMANVVGNEASDTTAVMLAWYPERDELWITQLQVAGIVRRQGLGKKLVAAAEQLALRLDARNIHVFPLHTARGFWLAIGYRPHPRTVRVVTKTLTTRRRET